MSNNSFEYTTSYFPLPYEQETQGMLMFKKDKPPVAPMPSAMINNDKYIQHMTAMGSDGWEMVTVQPALRGVYLMESNNPASISYPLTAGYFFWWKRQVTNP